ncbi:DUF922 domain-containing protein [Aestuariivirga sp.]|uniref:DUF922 domain-containing protein n=1 Tax=Aestuariivirga sp. TaxID=2650926 RepID=UPI003BAD7045
MSRFLGLVGAILVAALSGNALAGTTHSTNYSYYTVNGRTPAEIYRAILSRGPEVKGNKALASSSATVLRNGRLVQAANCQIVDFGLHMDFVINLPKLKNEAALPPSRRQLWRNFSRFLKAHEEHHAALWLGCAADLDRKVKAIKVKSCKQASQKVNQLWQQMLASCDKKQTAFDKSERQSLMKQPFMRGAVLGMAAE